MNCILSKNVRKFVQVRRITRNQPVNPHFIQLIEKQWKSDCIHSSLMREINHARGPFQICNRPTCLSEWVVRMVGGTISNLTSINFSRDYNTIIFLIGLLPKVYLHSTYNWIDLNHHSVFCHIRYISSLLCEQVPLSVKKVVHATSDIRLTHKSSKADMTWLLL